MPFPFLLILFIFIYGYCSEKGINNLDVTPLFIVLTEGLGPNYLSLIKREPYSMPLFYL